jgi:Na+(H+)/acetate symporter ActP
VARATTTVHLPGTVRVNVDHPIVVQAHGVIDGRRVDGPTRLPRGELLLESGTRITLEKGQPVPHVVDIAASTGRQWETPASGAGGRDHALYRLYSLLLALLFGTMGLPHVLVRFYTNPDGRAARRTTLAVIGLLGLFYVFPPFYGAMGRIYAPDLLMTGRTDAIVLLLPERMLAAPWGLLVSALVTAGAFAAFLSTSSGLTVSVAGVLSQDLLRGRLRASVRGFRLGAVIAVLAPAALSLLALRTSIADTVGLAFAVASSTFFPLLVLGIWWRRLTRMGAVAGLAVGGILASTAVTVTIVRGSSHGLLGALLAQPAAWTVPTAFAVMIGVSLLTQRTAPAGASQIMVRLHAPETLHLDRGEARGSTRADRSQGTPHGGPPRNELLHSGPRGNPAATDPARGTITHDRPDPSHHEPHPDTLS